MHTLSSDIEHTLQHSVVFAPQSCLFASVQSTVVAGVTPTGTVALRSPLGRARIGDEGPSRRELTLETAKAKERRGATKEGGSGGKMSFAVSLRDA